MGPSIAEYGLRRALEIFHEHSTLYEWYTDMLEHYRHERYRTSREHILAALEAGILAERLDLMEQHFSATGGLENATLEQYARFEITQDRIVRINRITAVRQMPRVFVHLYYHAHLLAEFGAPSLRTAMDGLVTELDLK